MIDYNIYFGTFDGPLKTTYRFTRSYANETEANNDAYRSMKTYYYQNEGTHGLPGYSDIKKENEITGVPIEKLYLEHINDLMRYFVVPTEVDTIKKKMLNYN